MEDNLIISNLLKQSEGERLEFKSDINPKAIAEVITSFINTKGGDLLIGINDDKSLSKINFTNDDEHKLKTYLIKEIQPLAPIFSRIETYKQKNLIMISVWEGANKPYHFKNNIFIRKDSQTIKSNNIVSALLNEKLNTEQRWERQSVLGASIEDLDIVEIQKSMKAYANYSSNDNFITPEQFLIRLGLIVNGNITNGCLVLFGKNPTQFISQTIIKLVVHPGTKSGDWFKENKIYNGSLFQNVRRILSDFDTFIGKENIIEGISRIEKKLYPEMALREGLLNAIVHRDYSTSQSFLVIELFSDRLVISNYGGLQNNMTVNDLKIEHNSILRNPDIAQMCFYNNLIEMLGTGTLRMIRNCKKEGYKIPKWKNTNNILELTFSGVKHQFEGVNEGVNEGVIFKIEGVNEGVLAELEYLYNTITKDEGKKAVELNNLINKSLATTERYLKILKDQGLIVFSGSSKTGGYYLNNKSKRS
jgi:ATP-dependent DNA helicase RecG